MLDGAKATRYERNLDSDRSGPGDRLGRLGRWHSSALSRRSAPAPGWLRATSAKERSDRASATCHPLITTSSATCCRPKRFWPVGSRIPAARNYRNCSTRCTWSTRDVLPAVIFPASARGSLPFSKLGHPYWGQWLAGALAAFFTFWAGCELAGNRIGLFAGLLTAASPGIALFDNLLLSHPPTHRRADAVSCSHSCGSCGRAALSTLFGPAAG